MGGEAGGAGSGEGQGGGRRVMGGSGTGPPSSLLSHILLVKWLGKAAKERMNRKKVRQVIPGDIDCAAEPKPCNTIPDARCRSPLHHR